jgi:hypothetical protein
MLSPTDTAMERPVFVKSFVAAVLATDAIAVGVPLTTTFISNDSFDDAVPPDAKMALATLIVPAFGHFHTFAVLFVLKAVDDVLP